MKFKDSNGLEYTFDAALHCGDRNGNTFCIVGPGHTGNHWDGERAWYQLSADIVTRYGVTFLDQDGDRILAFQNLRDTKEEAEVLLSQLKANNSASSLEMLTRGNPTSLEVRAVPAWRRTGDPVQQLF